MKALDLCIPLKRPDDLWRMERYAVEAQGLTPVASRSGPTSFYDDLVLGPNIKTQYGFIASPELLHKLNAAIGSKERTLVDMSTGIDRINEAMAKISGKRHLFLFLHPNSTEWPVSEARLQQLADFLKSERIAPHAFVLEYSAQWHGLRRVCLATPGGTFTVSPQEELPGVIQKLYSELVGRFEISYRTPSAGDSPGEVRLSVSTEIGCGEIAFSLQNTLQHITERQQEPGQPSGGLQ